MFYWPKFFTEIHHLDLLINELSPQRRSIFAAGCAWHAISRFRELRKQGSYIVAVDHLSGLLAIVDASLASIGNIPSLDAIRRLYIQLDSFLETVTEDLGAYNGGELIGAVINVVESLDDLASARRALLAAEDSYVAVSKWYDALAFPRQARTRQQILEFETKSPECQSELKFQADWLNFVHSEDIVPRSCKDIAQATAEKLN